MDTIAGLNLFDFFLQAIEPRRDMSVLTEQHAEDQLLGEPASLSMPKQESSQAESHLEFPALHLAAVTHFNHDC